MLPRLESISRLPLALLPVLIIACNHGDDSDSGAGGSSGETGNNSARLCFTQANGGGEPGILPVPARIRNTSGPYDALAITPNGALYIFDNDGTGAFTTRVAETFPSESFTAITISDLDRDGLHDVIVTEITDSISTLSVLMNYSGQLYPVEGSETDFSFTPVTGDFNGDGQMDVIGLSTYSKEYLLLPGLGDGTFSESVTGPLPCPSGDCYGDSPGVADFNGDGLDDVAVSDVLRDRFVVYLSNDGAPLGKAIELADGQQYYFRTIVTDLNLDGFADVAGLANGEILMYQGDGSGNFSPAIKVTLTDDTSSTIPTNTFNIADLDADGFLDALFVDKDYENELFIAFGNGAGGFLAPESFLQLGSDRFSIGNWNGDLRLDLFYETNVPVGDPKQPPTVSLSCIE